jgi:hypothetical protein
LKASGVVCPLMLTPPSLDDVRLLLLYVYVKVSCSFRHNCVCNGTAESVIAASHRRAQG